MWIKYENIEQTNAKWFNDFHNKYSTKNFSAMERQKKDLIACLEVAGHKTSQFRNCRSPWGTQYRSYKLAQIFQFWKHEYSFGHTFCSVWKHCSKNADGCKVVFGPVQLFWAKSCKQDTATPSTHRHLQGQNTQPYHPFRQDFISCAVNFMCFLFLKLQHPKLQNKLGCYIYYKIHVLHTKM